MGLDFGDTLPQHREWGAGRNVTLGKPVRRRLAQAIEANVVLGVWGR